MDSQRKEDDIKDVLRKCVICTRFQGVTAKRPSSPGLPDYTVNGLAHPLKATGFDFAGLLFVKEGSKKTKSYILLLIVGLFI